MSLTLRVLAPDQNVFDGSADEVILPSTTGQLGILTGHISMLTAIDVGVFACSSERLLEFHRLDGRFCRSRFRRSHRFGEQG